MDTNTGRFHLLTQMLISTTAVVTTASQTWLKWDFVIWIGCCLATLNHAADQKWGDGSLSPWLWQIPGAYIAYAFPSDSVPSMVSTALAASQITYIGSLFAHDLVEDLMEKEGDAATGRNNKRLSLRAQLRQSLANGATIVRKHGVKFRFSSYSSSSNTSSNSGSNVHLGEAAARRLDQQQAALERKRKKKEEMRLRQLRKKERVDEERTKRLKTMTSKVIAKTNQIKRASFEQEKEILKEAEAMCSEFQEDVRSVLL